MTITSTITGSIGTGITLTSASYANPVTVAGTIDTTGASGLYAATAWSIVNQGSISGTDGVSLQAGGSVDNLSSGVIEANAAKGVGVYLTASGSVVNAGTIGGAFGVRLISGGYVSNAGSGVIAAATGRAIYAMNGTATVVNAGSLVNTASDYTTVVLIKGGSIDNEAGALITSTYRAIYMGNTTSGGPGTITNAGTISTTNASHSAIVVEDGGSVLNTGLIDSNNRAIYFNGGATLTNAGTIAGTANLGQAVYFHAGYANDLIVNPGAVFAGLVNGGNTIGATAVSTLDLATGTSSGIVGTIGGLGTSFINFATITIDAGAIWDLTGFNSIAAGTNVSIGGHLNIDGSLANAGTIAGVVDLGVSGAFTNAAGGTVSGQDAVLMDDSGLSLGNAGVLTGVFGGVIASAGDTITNAGSITGGADGIEAGGDPPGGSTISVIANQTGALIAGGTYGIQIIGGGVTVTNAGTVEATGTGTSAAGIELGVAGYVLNSGSVSGSYGVQLNAGGTVVNGAAGVIEAGSGRGIGVTGGAGTVSNAGTIETAGTGHSGVFLDNGGSVDNAAGGLISSGYHAVNVFTAAGTVTNEGTITDSSTLYSAVALDVGGSVVNASGGTIAGAHHGVYIKGGGTLTNAGTIIGTNASTVAVDFIAGSPNRLIVESGAVFVGAVDGGNTIGATSVSVLELAAGGGTVAGFTNFGSIAFDAGAAWKISGPTAALAMGELISGFSPGDTIEITGVTASKTALTGDTLALSGGLNVILPGNTYTYAQFQTTNSSGNTDITVACFVAGTRILTDTGEVAVEEVRNGQKIVSLTHRYPLAVRWVGSRTVGCAAPVRIAAGAFGNGLPHRTLHLSPDHAVFVAGALIPVRHLINGGSVAQVACEAVTYFHVELEKHAILLAEGLPAESYLDTGNRAGFANAPRRLEATSG